MMTEEDIRFTLDKCLDEDGFDYKGKSYFYSRLIEEGKIYIFGPDNDEYVDTVDEVLDKLLVDGKPLREMLKYID